MTLATALLDVVLPLAVVAIAAAWLARRAIRSMRGKGAGCGCPASVAGKGCVKADEMSRAVRAAARKAATPR